MYHNEWKGTIALPFKTNQTESNASSAFEDNIDLISDWYSSNIGQTLPRNQTFWFNRVSMFGDWYVNNIWQVNLTFGFRKLRLRINELFKNVGRKKNFDFPYVKVNF